MPTVIGPTTKALPDTCPACGFTFGLLDVPTVQAHFLAHLVQVLTTTGADLPKAVSW